MSMIKAVSPKMALTEESTTQVVIVKEKPAAGKGDKYLPCLILTYWVR